MKKKNEMIAELENTLSEASRDEIISAMQRAIDAANAVDTTYVAALSVLFKNAQNKYGNEFLDEVENFIHYLEAMNDTEVERFLIKVNNISNVALMKQCDCYCSMQVFYIGHEEADSFDFGSSEDKDRSNAPDYGCGDRQFEAYNVDSELAKECMKKYNIDKESYEIIAEQLEEMLSFGCCAWCS